MTDDNLKTKRFSAQSQGNSAPVPASSISTLSQAGPGHIRIDSQQQVIVNQPSAGPIYTGIPQQQQQPQQHSMRTTASSNLPTVSTQRYDGTNVMYTQAMSADGRKPTQEGYSRQPAVSAQYYPRVLPPGSQMSAAPPIHTPGQGQNVAFAYNQVYTGPQPQQNVVSSSYLPQVYTQSAQHSLYPHGVTNTSQNPWADSQTIHQPGLVPQPESSQSSTHTIARSQQYHRSTQQPQLMVSTFPYPPIFLPMNHRPRCERPVEKLSLALIETYKKINEVYFEERELRRRQDPSAAASTNTGHTITTNGTSANYAMTQSTLHHKRPAKQPSTINPATVQIRGTGVNNNGWDDENFDYIVMEGELIYDRYSIQERIGKGSFGQVVRAYDTHANIEVAIKIIKSKKPFLFQARTEVELLSLMNEKDPEGQQNIVRLLTHFIYRNHQCLVFEMLSLNLYDLLKNTQFAGVSLNLLRKFGRQILKALQFLGRSDVDIIHCDLKPENILLKHPKRSNVKVIDFGSSCKSNKRMYTYIQSRFYRSPEVILGLPYTVAIDMWSLGCILVEMYTGEPLFSGTDQIDQMRKIVKILGMIPDDMLNQAQGEQKFQFFERAVRNDGVATWSLKPREDREHVVPSSAPLQSLSDSIGPEAAKKKRESTYPTGNTPENYQLFIDLIFKMLALRPEQRIKPQEALRHPFIADSQTSAMPPSGPDLSLSSSTEEVKQSD